MSLLHLNFNYSCLYVGTSLVAQMVKCLPAMRETWVQSLGQEDLLEKEMATHSSILAWKIPWTEESGRLQSMGSEYVCAQLCPILCNPMDCSLPGSTCPWDLPGNTGVHCHLLFQGTSKDLPDPGIEPASPSLAGRFFTTSATWENQNCPSLL